MGILTIPTGSTGTLMLGGADEWSLKSNFVSHPFHIHVNPFQIVKIIAPDGKTDVSAPGAVDNFARDGDDNPVVDTQYPGLKGVWKDTLFVKNVPIGGVRPGNIQLWCGRGTNATLATLSSTATSLTMKIKE